MLILQHSFCHWCRDAPDEAEQSMLSKREEAEREREARAEAVVGRDAGIAASGAAGSVVGDDGVRQPIGPTIFAAIEAFLRRHETLFVDDLWVWVEAHHDGWRNLGIDPGKYVGQQMQKAQREGMMAKIPVEGMPDCYVSKPSIRSHLAPKWVFRSKIFTPENLLDQPEGRP